MLTGYVQLTFRLEREDKVWVATCVELGTATQGRSFRRVRKAIKAMAVEHINFLEEEGERERFFAERNIQILPMPAPAAEVYQEYGLLPLPAAA